MSFLSLIRRLITPFTFSKGTLISKEETLEPPLPSEERKEESPEETIPEEEHTSETLEENTSNLEVAAVSLEAELSNSQKSSSIFTFLKNPIALIVTFMIIVAGISGYYWYKLVFQPTSNETPVITMLPPPIPQKNLPKKWADRNFIHPSYLTATPVENPTISIIIYDLGLNEHLTDMAFSSLPEEVGLAFSPYSLSLEEELETANVFGFTSLVMIPLESGMNHYQDLGRLTLLTGAPSEENQQKLKTLSEHLPPNQILLLQGGDIFLTSTEDLSPILSEFKKNSFTILSPPDCLMTQIHTLCRQIDLKYLPATKFVLPNQIHQLDTLWQETLEAAHELGYGIIIVPAMKFTIDSINQWIKNLDTSKISLISIQELFDQRE